MVARRNNRSGFRDKRLSGLLNICVLVSLVPMLALVAGCPFLMFFQPRVACTADDASNCPTDRPFCLVDAEDETGRSNACVACLSDADCDDATFCNGEESCDADNVCQDGTAPCTADQVCDEDADICRDVCTDDTDCDDGDFCNGAETCVDGACQDGTDPCADTPDTPVCDEDADDCFECLTATDCAEGEDCVGNACVPAVTEFGVTIDGCPESVGIGDTFTLTASTAGESADGEVTFAWTGSDNVTITGDDDDDPSTVDVAVNGAGDVDVTVSAQDNTVTVVPGTDPTPVDPEVACTTDGGECAADEVCLDDDGDGNGVCATPGTDDTTTTTPLGDPVTATCSPDLINIQPIQVNAGADRSAAAAFAASQPIIFTTAGIPLLQANAFDPSAQAGETLLYEWSVVSTPDATLQPNSTVSILQPFSAGNGATTVDVLINPPGISSVQTLLKQDGTTTTRTNVPTPGPYTFQVVVTNPRGNTASDTVARTITPNWAAQAAAGGSAAGLAATNGLYNTVLTPSAGADLMFQSLSRVTGGIDFTAVDDDDATKTTDLATVNVTPSDTVQTIMPNFPAHVVGTYSINAGLNAGEVSVAAADTGANVLVGTDLAATTENTELAIMAGTQVGAPQSTTGGRLYAGVANDAVGGAAATTNSEALRGQNVLFANIKNDGGMHLIVWGAADANANFDAQDVRIYKPLNNQAGNANTLGFVNTNFTFLEQVDTNCTVTDVAIGPLRGDSTRPELVVACQAADPQVKIYQNNGATGTNDKVYSVQSNQTTAASPSTITFDYTDSNTGNLPPQIELAPFSNASFSDLIFGDPGFDNGADGFIDGRVVILQGGTAGAVPAPGFSISTGPAFANLPANKWDSVSGVATNADDEPFFGFSLATGSFTSTTLRDVYAGGPGNDAFAQNTVSIPGSVFRIPAGTSLNSTDAATTSLSVRWTGEANGDQFGFTLATSPTGQVIVGAIQNGHTANMADGEGKVYVIAANTANATNVATLPAVLGEQASDVLGLRLATGTFEGADMLVVASSANYFKLVPTGGTLSNPIVPMTKVTIAATDANEALVIGDFNGDGKNDILVSRTGADQATALWGRQ